jgi:polyhydroxyalkanoate synthesis regulator phasin
MFEGWEVNGSPVVGTRERIEGMMTRFGELTDEVGRLEGLVEDQRRDLEMQNSSRMGGMYDDEDGVVTQTMVNEEEEQVRALEDKIKAMQVKVHHHNSGGH